MALAKEEKQKILEKFKTADNDTGSPEVQIALLTRTLISCKLTLRSIKKIITLELA